MPVQPDQPTALINYNTDQFTDPVTGATVHDDGSDFYFCQANGITYFKQRSKSGQYYSRVGDYLSYQITLVQRGVVPTTTEIGLVNPVTLEAWLDPSNKWYVVPGGGSAGNVGLVDSGFNAIVDGNGNLVVFWYAFFPQSDTDIVLIQDDAGNILQDIPGNLLAVGPAF